MKKLLFIVLMIAATTIQASHAPKENEPQPVHLSLFHGSQSEGSDSSNNCKHGQFQIIVFGGKNIYGKPDPFLDSLTPQQRLEYARIMSELLGMKEKELKKNCSQDQKLDMETK